MTQQVNPAAPPGAAHPDPSLGTIPIRLRIGVASDQDQADAPTPADDPALTATVRTQLDRLVDVLREGKSTTVRGRLNQLFSALRKPKPPVIELTVISQLASRTDRLVVGEILAFAEQHHQQATLEAVLPMRREEYLESQQWSESGRADLKQYLDRASLVVESRQSGDASGPAGDAVRNRLMSTSDILLVLWDGHQTAEPGGVAQTLRDAATLGIPCVWIATGPDALVEDNFGPGQSADFYEKVGQYTPAAATPALPKNPATADYDVLTPVRDWLRSLGRYNAEKQPRGLSRRLLTEFRYPDGDESWIAPYFVRATLLAQRYQARFTWSVWTLTILAIIAAAMLGAHLNLSSNLAWSWAEAASLVAITVVFLILHLGEYHDRWMSYRFLAERLRSARFIGPLVIHFSEFMTEATEYFPEFTPAVGKQSEQLSSGWIQRSLDEFWHSALEQREQSPPESDWPALRERLAETWIGGQMAYHGDRYIDHGGWQKALFRTILVLFAAAVVCAFLDADGVSRNVTGFLSVLCPAAGASLGALLTVRQHRQLAERSAQISRGLAVVQRQLLRTEERQVITDDDRRLILSAADRAAKIMAEENTSWLGALWFLDVEHPG